MQLAMLLKRLVREEARVFDKEKLRVPWEWGFLWCEDENMFSLIRVMPGSQAQRYQGGYFSGIPVGRVSTEYLSEVLWKYATVNEFHFFEVMFGYSTVVKSFGKEWPVDPLDAKFANMALN